jgi:hypothetical protein
MSGFLRCHFPLPRTTSHRMQTTPHQEDYDPHQEQQQPQQNAAAAAAAAFVESMTFAKRQRRPGTTSNGCCDCDECGSSRQPSSLMIPPPIRLAIQQHKRIKRETTQDGGGGSLMTRTQVRTLVRRWNCAMESSSSVCTAAVWQWFLPCGAEPLTEFGNASVHRLLWVARLPPHTLVSHVGPNGIIGSQMEEQGRIMMNDWHQGGVYYLVPSSVPGRAVGWVASPIHLDSVSPDSTTEATLPLPQQQQQQVDGGGPVVLYIAKIAVHDEKEDRSCVTKEHATDKKDNDSAALESIRSIFVRARHQFESSSLLANQQEALPLSAVIVSYCQLEAADSAEFRRIVSTLL